MSVDAFADCPSCGVTWGYKYSDRETGQAYDATRLVGRYDRDLDRTVDFQCPTCGAVFARGDIDFSAGKAWVPSYLELPGDHG